MQSLKLAEQILFLRRQKGMTQEELARALGVTNQAVSKWESSQCCPDIQLLPEIAKLFGVSIDALLGYEQTDSFENIYLKIKALFKESPAESAFRNAYRLSVLLHEAAVTGGYKGYAPWDTDKNHGLETEPYKWGFSACSEPEGNTVHAGNGVYIADGRLYQSPTPSQKRDLSISLKRLCEADVLNVLYALYELTVQNFDLYVPVSEIAKKAKLSEVQVDAALEKFPVTVKSDGGETLYRIDGAYMHIPPLLIMLRER